MRLLNTWKGTWALIRVSPAHFCTMSTLYIVGLTVRLLPGLVLERLFDRLSGATAAGANVWTLLGLLAAAELSRLVADTARVWSEETFRCDAWGRLRGNIMRNVLRRPGALPLPVAPGDAINRLTYDVMEFSDWPTWLPYVAGHGLFAILAVAVLWRVHPTMTAVIVLPLFAVIAIVQLSRSRFLRYYVAGRDASGAATGFLGEVLGAVQAIKVAGAERSVVARLERLNRTRQTAEIRGDMFLELERWAFDNVADLGRALILLMAARAMVAVGGGRALTVGEFALFVSYLPYLTDFPATLGGFIADYQTQAVSIRRMQELAPEEDGEALVDDPHARDSRIAATAPAGQARLERLTVTGLTYHHPESGRGIEDVSFEIEWGTFTVVTGRVGSGKTTLLRALLGLLPKDAGKIRWNSALVDDPATFFRPPHSAYTPQVPTLFSESLRDNILMGLDVPSNALDAAIHAAVLKQDMATLEAGLDTIVGPRGVRLSGGQVQRAAAARVVVRHPALLVFDDLSSALDVETERALWERLLAPTANGDRPTCLVVSHRPAALERADQVLIMQEGRLLE